MKIKKHFTIIITLLFINQTVYSQKYHQAALNLYGKVQGRFYDKKVKLYTDIDTLERKFSHLWGLCCMIQVVNELEKAEPKKDYMTNVLNVIDQYYSERKSIGGYDSYLVNLGGGDRYYDDNQWIGIALMDAFDRNKKKEYLTKSIMIYDFMMTGYDEAAGGGLYWREVDKITKNTCSNAPGAILALQLYKATQEEKYLKTAMNLYDWTNKRLRSPEGIFYDNVIIKTDTIDKHAYTYNTGAMLQTNVYLYEITKDKKYLTEAKTIAESSLKEFYNKAKFRDDYWFNAVMLRALKHLRKYDKNEKYLKAFQQCTDFALSNDLNSQGLMGVKHPANLVNQAGMIEILLRLSEKQ
jgi:uncharacterized protein YyaL (SSP411 family)